MRLRTQTLAMTLLAVLLGLPSLVQAEEPEADQRPIECGTMVGASEGIGDAFIAIAFEVYAIYTRLTPDIGFAYDATTETGWAQLSWPIDFAFAPVTGRKTLPRRCSDDVVLESKGSRILLEPMARIGSVDDALTARFHLRAGYRFLYRASESKVGAGAGLGSTVDFAGGVEASISPEIAVSFGECCSPGYLTASLRYDHYFASTRNVGSLQLGWTFH